MITSYLIFLDLGIHVSYDLSRPVGSRVVSATAQCAKCPVPIFEPVDPDASYNIILSSFIAGGGDNFTMIADHMTIIENFGM